MAIESRQLRFHRAYLWHSGSGFRQSKPLPLVALSNFIILLLLLLKARLSCSQSCLVFCYLPDKTQKVVDDHSSDAQPQSECSTKDHVIGQQAKGRK